MILGTPHLKHLPSTFQPASLTRLHERLFAWKPRIIAIEAISGTNVLSCANTHSATRKRSSLTARGTRHRRAATGLDVATASAEIDRLLASRLAAPTTAQRRRLAALFLAGGEPVSVLVQWLRRPEAERHAGNQVYPNDGTVKCLLVSSEIRASRLASRSSGGI
jgi:hypothetical protein